MLTKGEYRNNDGQVINIGGRIKDYSNDQPFVWSLQGNWYHEETGQFVDWSRTREGLKPVLHTVGAKRSIFVAPAKGEDND